MYLGVFVFCCYSREIQTHRETLMAPPCFQAKESVPPVGGVHNVPLVRDPIPFD